MNYKSKKFVLSSFFTVAGTLGMVIGRLSGGEYVALATIILGVYGTVNVAQKVFTTKKSDS